MSSDAVSFQRVTKVYQGRQIALADVSFALPTGATVGLLGANGSGKSTAIRIALGLITPSAGRVEVFGERMAPGAKLLRQQIGFLSDDPAFPKDLTPIHYLEFVGKSFGLDSQERRARLGTLLRAVGLLDEAGRRIATFSTGMKTRLGIAASLINDPELLVWDEPTAGLDPISRSQTLELLEKFRGRKTVLLSSHILGDIDRVCDRLLVLNHGQILFNGARSDLERLLPEAVLEVRVSGPAERFTAGARHRLDREIQCLDAGRFRVELRNGESVDQTLGTVLELIQAAGCKLEGVNSTGRRLEEAYLKLISEDEFRGFLGAGEPR